MVKSNCPEEQFITGTCFKGIQRLFFLIKQTCVCIQAALPFIGSASVAKTALGPFNLIGV